MLRDYLILPTLFGALLRREVTACTTATHTCESDGVHRSELDHVALLQTSIRLSSSHGDEPPTVPSWVLGPDGLFMEVQNVTPASLDPGMLAPAFSPPKTSPFPYNPNHFYGLGKAAARLDGFFKVEQKPNGCALSVPNVSYFPFTRYWSWAAPQPHWSRFSFGECPRVLVPGSVTRLEFDFGTAARGYNPSMVALPFKLHDAFPTGRWLVAVRTGLEQCTGATDLGTKLVGSHVAVLDENFQILTRTAIRVAHGDNYTDDMALADVRIIQVDGDEVKISFQPYTLDANPWAADEAQRLFPWDRRWSYHEVVAKLHLSPSKIKSRVALTAWIDRLESKVLLRCPDEKSWNQPSRHVLKNMGFFTSSGHLHALDMIHPLEVVKSQDFHEMQQAPWNAPTHITPLCAKDKDVKRSALRVLPWAGAVGQSSHDGLSDLEIHNGANLVWIENTKEYLGLGHFTRGYSDWYTTGVHLKYNQTTGYSFVEDISSRNTTTRFGHHYTHLFFTLSGTEPFHIKRMSPEFCFQSMQNPSDCETIQFASSLTLDGDKKLHVGYGVMDCESYLATFDIASVLQSLREVY